MSRADADAVTAVYEKWARGDFFTPEIFDEHVEVIWADEIPGLNKTRGLAALSATVRTWVEAWEHCSIAAESVHEHGDSVLVAYNSKARHRESPTDLEWAGAHVWTMRDGKAVRLKAFSDLQEAAAEAGIQLP
jgi:ketosteroid isomerase-like protein